MQNKMISPFQFQDNSTTPSPSTMHPTMSVTTEELLDLVEPRNQPSSMIVISPLQVQDISTAPSPCSMYPTMSATSEELFGVVEPVPLPPSVPMIHVDSKQTQDNLSMPYISRMLMEDDIIDKFFYQYPDHPKIQQAEQPFAQILSDAATTSSDNEESMPPGMHASALMPSQDHNMDIQIPELFSRKVLNPAFFLGGTDRVEPDSTMFPSESNISMDMLSSMAFFKGVEEANMFLPSNNVMVDGRVTCMDGEVVGMGRSSKQIAVPVHTDSEEDTVRLLDRLILDGYDKYPNEMQEVLLIDKENKAAQKSFCRRGRGRVAQTVVTDLETLLIRCAEAVDSNNWRSTSELLERIKQYCSPTGDARQRLAHYFAKGLEARLAGTGSQLYHSIMGTRTTSSVELIKAYHLYNANCCFIKMALLFSNRTIYNAVAGRRKLHIVHYGINSGFQWPELIRWLADREGGPPEVRITEINTPQPEFHPAKQIKGTGDWLRNYASKLGVSFKIHAITANPEAVRAEDLHIDPDEVLVVNSIFQFRTLMDESFTFERVNPRDMVLNTIRKMKPDVFVHAVCNGSYSAACFMTRFRQALYDFTALFDVMETTTGRNNNMRLLWERDIFGRCTMNMIACEGADRVERPHNYREWQARNHRAGLRQLPLDTNIVLMLKDEVKNQYHKHFMINEDHRWLLQGWKGRVLYALSTWVADDASGSEET